MSTKGVTKKDAFLSNVAVTYPTGSLVATELAPILPVMRYADTIFKDADDAIEYRNDVAEGTPANRVDFQVGTGVSYKTTRKALSSFILDKTVNNEEDIVKSEIRETNKLTHRLKLAHERRVADILTSTSKITNYTTLTTTGQWDDSGFTNAIFKAQIKTAVEVIYDTVGCSANVVGIPFKCALALANSPVVDDLKYTYSLEQLMGKIQNQIHSLVGLPPALQGLRVVIMDARLNNANKGESASKGDLWGDNVIIGYVPNTSTGDDTHGLLTAEYSGFQVYKETSTNPRGREIIVEWDYDLLEAELGCYYLYTDVLE
jgi:hypothetical protein